MKYLRFNMFLDISVALIFLGVGGIAPEHIEKILKVYFVYLVIRGVFEFFVVGWAYDPANLDTIKKTIERAEKKQTVEQVRKDLSRQSEELTQGIIKGKYSPNEIRARVKKLHEDLDKLKGQVEAEKIRRGQNGDNIH